MSSRFATRGSNCSVIEGLEGRRFLSVSPVSAALTVDPGNDKASAVDLGNFDKIKSTQADTIGTGDAIDYFKFTVTGNTSFSAKVKGAGKTGKLVKPSVTLFNASDSAAPSKTTTSAKQTLGAGTYYVVVTGQETGTTDYKLTLTTRAYKGKKAPTFTSTTEGSNGDPNGNPNGNPNGGGQDGGTVTGNLTSTSDPSGNVSDTYEYTATQSGTFELPATFADDVLWTFVAKNSQSTTGGQGFGPGSGTLSVTAEAGVDYVFNLVASNTATSYSVTLPASFSNLRLSEGN